MSLPFLLLLLLLHDTTVLLGLGLLFVEISRSISHTTPGGTPLDERATHKRQASIPLCGIQTHNPSNRVVTDPRIRQRGKRDRRHTASHKVITVFSEKTLCQPQFRLPQQAMISNYTSTFGSIRPLFAPHPRQRLSS